MPKRTSYKIVEGTVAYSSKAKVLFKSSGPIFPLGKRAVFWVAANAGYSREEDYCQDFASSCAEPCGEALEN